MPSEGTAVFVSYSHADASLVAPVVNLLRANKSFVFQDVDRIQPGKKWRSEIAKALTDAQLVVVFWCKHASLSSEVSNEWKSAIVQEKDLLPLLLDATPLPPELGEFQWIDFRGTVGTNHSSIESPTPKLKGRVKSNWLSVAVLATIVVAGVLVSLSPFILDINVETTPPIVDLPGVIETASASPSTAILLMVSVVLAVGACVAWFLRQRFKSPSATERVSSQPGEIERCIARDLEAEILRRTTTGQDVEA